MTTERRTSPSSPHSPAFTVLELLVAMTVFVLILTTVLSVIGQASGVWRRSVGNVEAFQGARAAFERLTRNLSQATLNSYLDYDRPDNPTKYLRKSELKFLIAPAGEDGVGTPFTGQSVFFQAPANVTEKIGDLDGLESLLNTCGYFIAFTDDDAERPSFVSAPSRSRYRLMELIVPTEKNEIYSANGTAWFKNHLNDAHPIAENIIALILRPQDPGATSPDLTTNYRYDTALEFSGTQPPISNQLPPVLHITMVAIDESAAKRLENGSSPPSAISSALNGKFRNTNQYASDLKDLEDTLNSADPPIPYRIFTSAVPLRESKWSK